MYPIVRVSGGPRERGLQYGRATSAGVQRTLKTYDAVFRHMRGWEWSRAAAEAARFEDVIGDYEPKYLEEISGIAEGAGVDRIDILTLNVRTEIMFGTGLGLTNGVAPVSECTSFVALHGRTAGRVLLGQNWDWLVPASEQIVILECVQDNGPAFVTVVEAGLLAKIGFNSTGLGIATNALITNSDLGHPGVPFHVTLRALFDCSSPAEALTALGRAQRSSSGNYLVASENGEALDIEGIAGGSDELLARTPENGFFHHTNHFLDERFQGEDVMTLGMSPSSGMRLERLGQLAAERNGDLDASFFFDALSDHEHGQMGICLHADPSLPLEERPASLCGLVMDLSNRVMWLASGQPCEVGFEKYDYADFLS